MAADAPSAADKQQPLTKDVRGSVEGYRAVALGVLGLLAGVPTAAGLLSYLLPAPANGFHEAQLGIGLGLLVCGVVGGVAVYVVVRVPTEVSTGELLQFDMGRLPGINQSSYAELSQAVDEVTQEYANAQGETARQDAERRLKDLTAAMARVQAVAAADKLKRRVTDRRTIGLLVLAVALCAVAGFFLAIAPRQKADETAATKAVTVTLTADQAKQLGCPKTSFTALRIGGSDKQPEIVPLGVSCSAGSYIKLTVDDPKPTAEKVTDAEAAEPGTATATPSPATATATPSPATATATPSP